MNDGLNLNRLSFFAAVIETGSFTRAAERLGLGKTAVSQHVARLEQELGVSLLVRTTRRVQPTEAGRQLYARCKTILNEADTALAELSEVNTEPRGILRITHRATSAPSWLRRWPAHSARLIPKSASSSFCPTRSLTS